MLYLHYGFQGLQLALHNCKTVYLRFGEAVAAFLRGRRERLAGFAFALVLGFEASIDSLPVSSSALSVLLCFRFGPLLVSLCTLSLSPALELLLLVSESSSPPSENKDSSVYSTQSQI